MPITPRTISAAENSRQNPAESPKKKIPINSVPTAPIPGGTNKTKP